MSKYDEVSFSPTAKLPFKDKVAYSAGAGFTLNASWVAFAFFLMFFYTDVLGISPIVAGTIMLGARIFDAITDIFMGYAVDKYRFKWGKYRSWLVIGAIPATLFFIGVFYAIPTEVMAYKIAWASFTYGLFGAVTATLLFIPMTAQVVNITKNIGERASIAGIRMVFQNGSQILVAVAYMPLIMLFGGNEGDMARGFFWATTIFAVISLLILLGTIAVTKKYELNEDGTPREHLADAQPKPAATQVKDVLTNRPAMVTMIGQFFQFTMQALRLGVIVYIFTYYFALPDFTMIAMVVLTAFAIPGALIVKYLIRLFKDSNRAFVITMFISAASSILFYYATISMGIEAATASVQYGFLFWVFAFYGITYGAHFAFTGIVIPNTVEYGAWKTGKHQPGLIFALLGLCLTFGSAVGGWLLGFGLEVAGYVPHVTQSAETSRAILFIAFMLPSILTIIQAILQCFYGLNDTKIQDYVQDLQGRGSTGGVAL